MLIQINDSAVIAQAFILSAILRTDLVPLPVSLELELKYDDGLAKELIEGTTLYVSSKAIPLQIVKSEIKKSLDNPNRGVIVIVALLANCVAIGFRRQKAVILKNNSLGAIFKACGAKISIKNDFTVPLFASFVGQLPSEMIAKVLQEESAVIRLDNKQLDCMRLADLVKQPPKLNLPQGVGEQIESGFLQRHLVPSFYTTDDNRAIVKGNTQKVRDLQYVSRHSQKSTYAMTAALIVKHIITLSYDEDYQAGDVVTIDSKPMAIVTAAHVWQTENEGEQASQYTRLWLGELET
jgi:hypothetical protein